MVSQHYLGLNQQMATFPPLYVNLAHPIPWGPDVQRTCKGSLRVTLGFSLFSVKVRNTQGFEGGNWRDTPV